jgi:hypothetical protein
MNPSLSAKIHLKSPDKVRRYQLAVAPAGFEPSKIGKDGFDNFAEQSWTHAVRPRAQARGEERSPAPNNPSLPLAPRPLNEVPAASVIEARIRTLEDRKGRVRQLCRAKLDARSAAPSKARGERLSSREQSLSCDNPATSQGSAVASSEFVSGITVSRTEAARIASPTSH